MPEVNQIQETINNLIRRRSELVASLDASNDIEDVVGKLEINQNSINFLMELKIRIQEEKRIAKAKGPLTNKPVTFRPTMIE